MKNVFGPVLPSIILINIYAVDTQTESRGVTMFYLLPLEDANSLLTPIKIHQISFFAQINTTNEAVHQHSIHKKEPTV